MKSRGLQCFGLTIETDVELSYLMQTATGLSDFDVKIELGAVDDRLSNFSLCDPYTRLFKDRCIIDIPDVAKYEVIEGQTIRIAPYFAAQPPAIQAYLMGTAFGVLMHQRMDLPLHVSAVLADNGCLAFTGPSGAGKSSLAAHLSMKALAPLVTDDVARVVEHGSGEYSLFAGPRKLKLWEDAAEWLNVPIATAERDLARENKYHFDGSSRSWVHSGRFKALVYLRRNRENRLSLERAWGEQAFRIVLASIYRPTVGALIQGEQELVLRAARLANAIDVYMLSRPWGFDHMKSIEDLLRADGLL